MDNHPSPSERMRRRGGWLALAGLIGACLCAGPAPAAETPAPGTAYSGILDLGDAQVPLPDGEWVMAGRGYDMVGDINDAAYGAIETYVLFRLDGRKVTAFATVQHNLIPIETGWGVAGECVRTDLPLRVVFDGDEGHSRCAFAGEIDTGAGAPSPWFWKSALAYAANQNLALPQRWTMAGLRMSDRRDVVDVRYYFSPELLAGIPAAAPARNEGAQDAGSSWLSYIPGWGSGAAAPKPTQPDAAALAVMDGWLQRMQYLLSLGFNRNLAGMPPAAMPAAAGTAAGGEAIQQQQQQRLDALKAAHVVGNQFYAQRSAAIRDSQVTVAPEHLSALELTAVKAAADQSTTIVENVVVDAIVLGSFAQTIALLPLQTLADTLQFTSHEYAWNTLGPNRVRESPTIDFVEVGRIVR
jgi:hypothetical protein